MQLNNFKSVVGIYEFETSNLKLGLEKLGKKVLLHIKSNKTVYMQIGKVCVYGVITATGLLITNTPVFASSGWVEPANAKAGEFYYGIVALCSWAIIGKACWDMAVACINGEARKAPSIGLSYLVVAVVIYAMPMLMNAIKNLFIM